MAELRARLGVRGANELVSRAMQELAVQLAKVHNAVGQNRLSDVHAAARNIEKVCSQVGLKTLGRVGGDVARLSASNDSTAFAASVARLARIGELSLVAVWELQDLSG